MFYRQCWTCGERWELGAASTCKCPEELPAYTFKPTKPVLVHRGFKPNYNMTFHRDGKQVGVLDFNGPEMTFTGDTDESAKLFFDLIARSFKERLEQERAAREFVGLTDEEIDEATAYANPHCDEFDFARAIEAKLRSKNEDRN